MQVKAETNCTRSRCCRSEDTVFSKNLAGRWVSSSCCHHETRVTTAARRGSRPTCLASRRGGAGGRRDVQSLSSLLGGPEAESLGTQLILQRTPLFTVFANLTIWHVGKRTSYWAQAVQQSPDTAAWKAAESAAIGRLWKQSGLLSGN